MTPPTLIGIDAGGTSTRAIVSQGGRVVDRMIGAPLNVLLHGDALDRLAAMITSAGATAAGLGLAGVRSPEAAAAIARALEERTGARAVVVDDAEAAQLGAFAGGVGIVVIAGTGSAGYGRGADGVSRRVGGHGFLLGDEGGGYWIGNQAVRRALMAADAILPAVPELEALLCKHFGVSDVTELEGAVYSEPTDRAALAGLVPGLAESLDPAAGQILGEAADSLAVLVTALRAELGPLPVAMVGGVWQAPAVRSRFVALTGAVDPLEPPEVGALRLVGDQSSWVSA